MRETNGKNLGTQLRMTTGTVPVERKRMKPVKNDRWHKPQGGLWTSTYLGEQDLSDWFRWGEAEQMADRNQNLWLLTPSDNARILAIDSLADLIEVHAKYHETTVSERGYDFRDALDFEAMKRDGYDGLNLTNEGQWATRHSKPGLYGWDCESTVWLRWAFVEVVKVEQNQLAMAG